MNSLLVESRNPIYQLSHAGLKGDTYGWLCSRAQEHGEKESLPLLQKCLGSLKISPKSSWCRTHWLKGGFIQKGKRGISHPELTHLGGVDVPGSVIQPPAALRSYHGQCVASQLLSSHPRAALLLQEGAVHSRHSSLPERMLICTSLSVNST